MFVAFTDHIQMVSGIIKHLDRISLQCFPAVFCRFYFIISYIFMDAHVRIQREGNGGPDPPEKAQKKIGFLSNSGPDPLKNYEATEPAFNVGPSSARLRNTI